MVLQGEGASEQGKGRSQQQRRSRTSPCRAPAAAWGSGASSTTPHSPPESRAGGKSKRVPVPGQSRSWLPARTRACHML